MTIAIEKTSTEILVKSDYNTRFIAGARKLGGQWRSPVWAFDVRNERLVRTLCKDCYGTDGFTAADLVSVKLTLEDWSAYCGPITLFGRTIARATGRDSGARLGDGIVLLAGGFKSGGSIKNWRTKTDYAEVLVHDVPHHLVEELVARNLADLTVEIVPATGPIDRDALKAEKDGLLARISEIDALLTV